MARRSPSESIFTHFSVALGVLLISAALVIAPQGRVLSATTAPRLDEVPSQSSPAAMQPEDAGSPFLRSDALVSARGGREETHTAPTGTPGVLVAPPIASPSPSATAVPPTLTPTAVPPTPTPVPPTPTAVPPTSTPVPPPPPTATPAPPAPALNFRVGIQSGHWKSAELPAELAALRRSTGAAGSGWTEAEVNLAISNRIAAKLRAKGMTVDLLPATVPVKYEADAFLSIHGDANSNTTISGYKLARARWSRIPQAEDALIGLISAEYGAATGLREHNSSITENMRQYYAFNWQSFQHAVAPTTPSAILELGFLTTAADRKVILGQQDAIAVAIATGITRFLTGK